VRSRRQRGFLGFGILHEEAVGRKAWPMSIEYAALAKFTSFILAFDLNAHSSHLKINS